MTEPASSRPPGRITVELGPRSYEIEVVTGLASAFGPFARRALERSWTGSSCRRAVIVTDAHIADRSIPTLYQPALESAGIAADVVVPAGESSKSLSQAGRLYDELAARAADRHTLLVALGGGVVGDLAGFVAATFARGLPLIMVPTSLLAQVDSSVGGKVGINHPRAKNLIGAFYQPLGVWIDTETLATLPDREFRSGLAEVVKYGVIAGEPLLSFLEQNAGSILARTPETLERIIAESCRIKARVVARDEREEGEDRATLNFGHTIAHAIENALGLRRPVLARRSRRDRHGRRNQAGAAAGMDERRPRSSIGQPPRVPRPSRQGARARSGHAQAGDGPRQEESPRQDPLRLGRARSDEPQLTDSPGDGDVQAILETL